MERLLSWQEDLAQDFDSQIYVIFSFDKKI